MQFILLILITAGCLSLQDISKKCYSCVGDNKKMGIYTYYFISVLVTMIVFVLNLSGTHLKFKTKIPANARYKLVCRNFAFDNHNINQRQNVIYDGI